MSENSEGIQTRRAIFITGPVRSSGRSGSSWGVNEKSDWDTILWDAKEDIAFNVETASALGFKTFFFYWTNEEIATGLNIPNLELIPIQDPFMEKDRTLREENLPKLIKDLGPLAKNFTYNDQRQAFASHFGFTYLLNLGFEVSIRIRSDQRMNWISLTTDLMHAYNKKRILLPAQKSLTSLDAGYTGFSVLDFFYGGETRFLSNWFSDVLVGGRLYGPHQDIAWKPLMNSSRWKKFFPGLSILSDINNSERQTSMAQIFWQEFAIPSSKESMNQIVWRGNKLKNIDYAISRDELLHDKIQVIENPIRNFLPGANFPIHFEWNLVTSYLMGETMSDSAKNMILKDVLLDHLRYILETDKHKKNSLYLQIIKSLLYSKFPVIRRLVHYGRRLTFKL